MVDATLFFTPHQDDETLSMGSAIIEHVEKVIHMSYYAQMGVNL